MTGFTTKNLRFWMAVAVLALTAPRGVAADENVKERGQRIWETQCVECHGAGGEGVDGEYDKPLYGNWSIEKLTRIIHKTMPEETPETCEGADAGAVAAYIYDAFYSLDARARLTPARIELSRLTNRQYLNSVADILKHFDGDGRIGSERGLRGIYYNARNFDRKKLAFERNDSQVHFDFGELSPDIGQFTNNTEFAIQWKGSLIADETGDYEFVVKTENGARLWVNETDDMLIDGWVSSGQRVEHRARVRLIGGRAYPIRLDYFKFKDKTASISLEWKAPHQVQEPIPRRHLSPQGISSTLVIATPFPPDDNSVGYERGVLISKAWDEATTHAAIEVANHVVNRLDRLARTKPDAGDREEKVREFARKFVEVSFRRPLTAEQETLFVDSQFAKDGKIEAAIKRVVLLALKSPRFLYPGLNSGAADDWEIASRLSYGLWDSLPDRDLFELAKKGSLHTREQVRVQAGRMLENPRTKSKVQYFLHHWLQMNRIESLAKDQDLYPGFTPQLAADLRTSLNLFLEDAMWGGGSDYRDLLLSNALYVNARLADYYGVKGDVGDEFVRVVLPEKQRSGVLTHPYLLAAFSYTKTTSPIHRGVFLTRNIVGRALKPPPMAIEFKDNDFPANLTMREKVAELTRSDACQSCHSVINPLGFSLENFDAVGRWRTTADAKPIDATSDYTTTEGETIRLTGARDLAGYATNSEQGRDAFIGRLFQQIVKQPMLAYGAGIQEQLRAAFVESNFSVEQLLVEMSTIAALHEERSIAKNN